MSKEQLETLLNLCRCKRDKTFTTLLWYSGIRVSEAVDVSAKDFNWDEGTVVILGKGNRYRKALASNGFARHWCSSQDTFEVSKAGAQTMMKRLARETGIKYNPHSFRRGFCVYQIKSGLSTRIVQTLGGIVRL